MENVVKLSGQLKVDSKHGDCIKRLETKLNSIPNFKTRKMDIEVLLLACNIVEQLINNKTKKYNKELCVLTAYDLVFGALSEVEKTTIKKNIAYLIDSGSVIKSSYCDIFWHYFTRLFLKKD